MNLAAEGLAFPGFPMLLGPYNTFDARIHLAQRLFDLSALRRYQSSRRRSAITALEEGLAREQVSAAAGLSYVEALRADKAQEAALADLDLADALKTLAQNQHQAGVATGIDVARARTRAAQARLKLLETRVARRQAYLRLERVVGLPLRGDVVLADSLSPGTTAAPTLEEAVQAALAERLELRIARERLEADRTALGGVRAQYLPSLALNGDYGWSANDPATNGHATGGAGVALQLPLWTGGSLQGRSEEAEAAVAGSEAALQDLASQVDEDVRLATETLLAAADEVNTAQEVVQLTERELQLARDRFSSGVADNIELVNAQDALAGSRDAEVASLSRFHVARINLALALGRMEAFRI